MLPAGYRHIILVFMNTLAEIESAIERLSTPAAAELAVWLEQFLARRATPPPVEAWLECARGVARPGVTTGDVMTLTRGEE